MAFIWNWTVFVVFAVVICVIQVTTNAANGSNVNSEDFDVKPGGMVQEHERNWLWSMTLSHSEDKQHWQCRVERPGGMSYLFFQQFKLQVSGVSLEDVEVLGSGGAPLSEAEYAKDKSTNSVSHVEGKFGSQLSGVVINAAVSKSEL